MVILQNEHAYKQILFSLMRIELIITPPEESQQANAEIYVVYFMSITNTPE